VGGARGKETCVSTTVGKARVWLLALAAAALVIDGSAPISEAPASSGEEPAARDAPAVALLLSGVNPSLSEPELQRIAAAVIRYSEKYDLDPDLVTAILLVESSARPWARSPKGALGLMQVMPAMMRPMGIAGNLSTIETNIEAGCLILAGNIRRLGEEDGISAYFWGSDIRGVSYLSRVQAARARVRQELRS
jgi:soluble lytic murein transglycosylase-like protein